MNAYELQVWQMSVDEVKALIETNRQQTDRIAELEKDLALKTRDRDVFCDFTLAYEKRIEELEKLVEEMKYEKSSGVYDVSNKPVAWIRSGDDQLSLVKEKDDGYMQWKPLYTQPVKQLSDDEIMNTFENCLFDGGFNAIEFARAIIKEITK